MDIATKNTAHPEISRPKNGNDMDKAAKDASIDNPAVYAMQKLQRDMAGEAERTGLTSEEDVMALVKKLRTH